MALRSVPSSRSLRGFLPDGVEGIAPTSLATALAGSQLLLGQSSGRVSYVRQLEFTPEGSATVKRGFLGNGSSQLLSCTTPLVTSLPVTFAAWIVPGSLASEQYLLTEGELQGTGAFVGLRLAGGGSDDVSYVCRMINGGALINLTGGAAVVGQPCHIVGRSLSVSDHRLFFNGTSVNNSTSAVELSTGTWANTIIGALRRSTTTGYSSSTILQWAIWDRGLRDDEILSLYTDPWRMYWIPERRVIFDLGAAAAYTPSAGALAFASIAPSLGFAIHMPDEL
jgi:hypothetical protein